MPILTRLNVPIALFEYIKDLFNLIGNIKKIWAGLLFLYIL